jgi:hypothetical protein
LVATVADIERASYITRASRRNEKIQHSRGDGFTPEYGAVHFSCRSAA